MFIRTSALTPIELRAAIIREPLVVSPDTTVIEAIAQMSGVHTICNTTRIADAQLEDFYLKARSSCVLVVENHQLLGIVTERDMVRLSAQQLPLDNLAIQQVMTHSVVTLRESAFTDLFFAINLLQQHHIRHLPLVDEQNRLVGLVTHESLRQTSRPIDLLRLRLVSEVMISKVICGTPDSDILAIAQQMAQHHVSSVMIVEARDSPTEPLQIPVGILTERDLVQFQALGLSLKNCKAQAVMSTPIFTVKPSVSLWAVQQMMEEHLINRLAVTGEQGELLGIITQSNLLQALNPLELYNLAEVLDAKVVKLEAEKLALLENRNAELARQVEERTLTLHKKAQREKLVAEIATQIRSSLTLQTILDTIVEQVRLILNCDRVNIWRFEADWQTLAVAESTNSPLSLVGKLINDTCFKQDKAEIYRQGRIRVVSDIYTTEMSDCHRQMLIDLQTRAKILVPLLCGDELWGLLNATESQHPRQWQSEEIELLQALSVHIAIALQQATTYEKLQDELRLRKQAEAALQQLNQELETKVEQRTVALQASEANYRAILEAIPDLLLRLRRDGTCLAYIKPRHNAENFLPIAHHISEILPPELVQKQLDIIEQAIVTGKLQVYEHQFVNQNRTMCQEIRILAISDQEVLAMVRDKSERKMLEEKLIYSENKMRFIFESIIDIILTINIQGEEIGSIDIAPTSNSLINTSYTEIIDTTVNKLLLDSSNNGWFQKVIEVATSGKTTQFDYSLFIGADMLWFSAVISPINATTVTWVARDISDRKRGETELQKVSERLTLSLKSGAIGCWEWDIRQNTILWDDRMYELYGVTKKSDSSVVYDLWINGLHPDDRISTERLIQQAVLGQAEYDIEFRVIHPDGSIHFIKAFGAVVKDTEGNPQSMIGVNFDISDRKQAEASLKKSQALLSEAQEVAQIGSWEYDITTGKIIWSDELFKITERDPRLGEPSYEENLQLYHPDDAIELDRAVEHITLTGEPYKLRLRLLKPDGSTKYTQARGQVKFNEIGEITRLFGTSQDITELVKIEEALRQESAARSILLGELQESEARYRSVIASMTEGIVLQQADGQITACNQSAEKILGLTADQMRGLTSVDFEKRTIREDGSAFPAEHHPPIVTLRTGEPQTNVIMGISDADCAIKWISINSQPLFYPNETQPYAVVTSFSDITQKRLAQEILKHQAEQERLRAMTDGLTQVPNRRCFDDRLQGEWSRLLREQQWLSLIILDIDYFKRYNDHYGHQGGDTCLIQVAQTAAKQLKRPADLFARYGGEEFAVILPNTDRMGAIAVAELIQQAIRDLAIPHQNSEVSQIVTVSMGIASLIPNSEQSPDHLIALADNFLYQAKKQGRNQLAVDLK